MENVFLTSLTTPEIRSLFKEELEKYFDRNPVFEKAVNTNERLTRNEVAEQFKISLSTIHKAMRAGNLPFSKVGRKTIFRREDVEAFFQSNRK